jgi:hypothetical protein
MCNVNPHAVLNTVGGKIAVSGLGSYDEDEFILNLLNEQNIWTDLLFATDVSFARTRHANRVL